MRKQLAAFFAWALCISQCAFPQMMVMRRPIVTGAAAITLDASCSGLSAATPTPCSSTMTVSAGDTITCAASGMGSDPVSLYFNDPVNGFYDNVYGIVHPTNTASWVATAMFTNAAAGTYAPNVNNYEGTFLNIQCQAWKGTRTSLAFDAGGVNLTQSATAANPTAGTAAAPTNANEVVLGFLARATSATTSSGGGSWLPAGTLTGVTENLAQYFEYQIQTTATAVNAPFTSASAAFIDTQFAVLNASNPAGYRPFTGFFGVPAIAKTNNASVTAADLAGSTTTLTSLRPYDGANIWILSGSAATYSTAVAPTGTGKIAVQGVGHTFGDAGTSVHFSTAQTANYYEYDDLTYNQGQGMNLNAFIRVGGTGIANSTFCDLLNLQGAVSDGSMFLQAQYNSGTLQFVLEPAESGSSARLTAGAVDTDLWVQVHVAAVAERYHQLLVYTKSGTWSLSQTLNYDRLCTNGNNALCTIPTAVATTTGTASSASTALTVASGTGIVAGQVVIGTNIPWMTTVASVVGTAVTLSQPTSGALSSTSVSFYGALPQAITATNGTASSGSTALTVVAPGYGVIAIGNAVAGTGIPAGTMVTAVSGTSVTLSQPTTAALSNTGVSFWTTHNQLGLVRFGKYSSCNMAVDVYFSGMMYDPTASWGAFAPN